MSIYDRFEQHADKTFDEAARRYMTEFAGKDGKRQQLALDSVSTYIGNLRLIDVDDEAMAVFKRHRLTGKGAFTKPAMAGTVNKELTVVSTVLNKACRYWRWLPSTPKFQRVKGDTRIAYPPDWDEQERWLMALPSQWERYAALFAVNTGVRKAELFGLRWTDHTPIPDFPQHAVWILRGTKNSETRAVICNSIARRAVGRMASTGSEFVFPQRWEGGRIRQSGKVWAAAWIRAGLPSSPLVRKGIHNLRHACGQRLRAAGVTDEDRDSILGHNKHNISQHYALPDLKRLLEAVERITKPRSTFVLRDTALTG